MSTFAAGASGNDRRDLIKSQPAENSAETTTKFLDFKREVRDALLNVQIGIELESLNKPDVRENLRSAIIKLFNSMTDKDSGVESQETKQVIREENL